MATNPSLFASLPAASFLEYAFLRWVLTPAMRPEALSFILPQHHAECNGHDYRIDYAIEGQALHVAVELDGFEYHSDRQAFTYDRLRQNDLHANGWIVIRFSYDSIRTETQRCVVQLQALLARDPVLAGFLYQNPAIEPPEMEPDPWYSYAPVPRTQKRAAPSQLPQYDQIPTPTEPQSGEPYFSAVRERINLKTLRDCQIEALFALGNYYRTGGKNAACVMSVGAGKTALGVAACLAFAKRRALIVTPGSVIRGTFGKALDHEALGNALFGLPGGPLVSGIRPPKVLVLDRDDGPIRGVSRVQLLDADIIVTNFHSLGTGDREDDLLSKLHSADIDLIAVDEAHMAAAESYQRAFRHFRDAKTLLMSACFQRLDSKPIDADVVYRYQLIDSIADGNAKNLRVMRFAPNSQETTYEIVWPDGRREEIVGREALLEIVKDERKLALITARSDASIRQVMNAVRSALHRQARLLYPIKPRVLFSALGQRHAEQVARVASEYAIPCDYLHYSMSEARINSVRARFEQDSGDLQGIVQLKMLGQGYDFPPITVVVPMRPYGSFNEFYQFIGRGIRVLTNPALNGRVEPKDQFLDIIYHAELGLDDHIETIYRENDMDMANLYHLVGTDGDAIVNAIPAEDDGGTEGGYSSGPHVSDTLAQTDAFVLFERGQIEKRVIHDAARVEQRRKEREQESLAQRYAAYVQSTKNPMPFDKFVQLLRMLNA